MELREYIRIIFKSIWLIIPLTLLALSGTMWFSYSRQPIYEAQSTYLIAFGQSTGGVDQTDRYYILDGIVGRQQIAVNFCSIITSGDNITAAWEGIGVTQQMIADGVIDIAKYTVNCTVLPESSVLLVITQGPSLELIQRFNSKVGELGKLRAEGAYNQLLTLSTVDATFTLPDPVSPNHIQNAALGIVLGILVSVTVALLTEYFRSPSEKLKDLAIRDPLTNAYNMNYFGKRLEEERERARQRNRPLSVGLIEIRPNEDFGLYPQALRDDFMHQVAQTIMDKVQQGDIVAFRGGMEFLVLMPETPGYEGRNRMIIVYSTLRSQLFRVEEYATSFSAKIGVAESGGDMLMQINMIDKAEEALFKAQDSRDRNVHMVTTLSSAFVLEDVISGEIEDSLESERVNRVPVVMGNNRREGARNIAGLLGGASRPADEDNKRGNRKEQDKQSKVNALFGSSDLGGALDTSEFDIHAQLYPDAATDAAPTNGDAIEKLASSQSAYDASISPEREEIDADQDWRTRAPLDASFLNEPPLEEEDTNEVATLYYDPTTDIFNNRRSPDDEDPSR